MFLKFWTMEGLTLKGRLLPVKGEVILHAVRTQTGMVLTSHGVTTTTDARTIM